MLNCQVRSNYTDLNVWRHIERMENESRIRHSFCVDCKGRTIQTKMKSRKRKIAKTIESIKSAPYIGISIHEQTHEILVRIAWMCKSTILVCWNEQMCSMRWKKNETTLEKKTHTNSIALLCANKIYDSRISMLTNSI